MISVGKNELKIGELAAVTGLTKRTIDYYTNLQLIHARKDSNNYRLYNESTVDILHFIESMKVEGKSLDEIKCLLASNRLEELCASQDVEEIDIQDVRVKMIQLNQDITKLVKQLEEQSDLSESSKTKRNLKVESLSLMHSLLLLIN